MRSKQKAKILVEQRLARDRTEAYDDARALAIELARGESSVRFDPMRAAIAGAADRNSGDVRDAQVLATLLVGGSGMWVVRRLSDATGISLRSGGPDQCAEELIAAIGLALGLPDVIAAAHESLGKQWGTGTSSPSAHLLQELSELTIAALPDTALLVSGTDAELLENVAKHLADVSWSSTVCAPAHDSRRSQWDALPGTAGQTSN